MIVWQCIVTDSLWIKQTDAQNSNFISITTLHVPGSLSALHQQFLAVIRLWYVLCSCDDRLLPGVGWNGVPSYLKISSFGKLIVQLQFNCKYNVRIWIGSYLLTTLLVNSSSLASLGYGHFVTYSQDRSCAIYCIYFITTHSWYSSIYIL